MPVLMKRSINDVNTRMALKTIATKFAEYGNASDILGSTKNASSILPQCGNASCRSGWIKLWRSRQSPVLEGKWACSQACMQVITHAAILREAEGNSPKTMHRHRVPIGLVLLSQGRITQEQLRKALEAQRKTGTGRLGEWLIRHKAVDEDHLARALGSQWNCPVLMGSPHDPITMAAVLPRLLVDHFGAVPLRLAGRCLLYVAFEDKIDRCLILAIERMLGLKVEAGVLRESEFRRVQQEALKAPFPKTRLLEATSLRGLVHAVATMLEERKALHSRIVRIHNYFWLRIWRHSVATDDQKVLPTGEDVEDMVCALNADE